MNRYPYNSTIKFTVTFKVANVLTDPTAVTFKMKDPARTLTTYTYGVGATVVKDSTGTYHANVQLTTVGQWDYRWEGTGTAAGVNEGSCYVDDGAFD